MPAVTKTTIGNGANTLAATTLDVAIEGQPSFRARLVNEMTSRVAQAHPVSLCTQK